MRYVPLEDTFYCKFTTRDFDTGAPQTLGGTPVISAYEDANLTQITAGITITASYDSVTGLNHVAVVASAANGYESGKYYALVITTGTVDGVSVVGEVIHEFMVGPVEADLVQIGADSQSATDLKDFADAGYDPATNKVQGVALADTVTTLTGHTAQTGDNYARLGAPAGASVSADVAAVKAETALIVADTNELQTDDVPGLIASLDAVVDTVKAETALIVADTNELQTDWADGGRLDVIQDANLSANVALAAAFGTPAVDLAADIAAVKAETALIVADTNELQTDWANGGRLDLILDATATASALATVGTNVDAILEDTGTTLPAAIPSVSDILTTQMTESYAADGVAPTLTQAIMLTQQMLTDTFAAGTTLTARKLDGSTVAATFTLNDGTDPTDITRDP